MAKFTIKRLQRDKHFGSTGERKFHKALRNTRTKELVQGYLEKRGKMRRGYSEKTFKKYLRNEKGARISKVGKKAVMDYLNEYGKSEKSTKKEMSGSATKEAKKNTVRAPETSSARPSGLFGSSQRYQQADQGRYKQAARASARIRSEFAGGIKTSASYGDRANRVNFSPRNTALRIPPGRGSSVRGINPKI